MCSTFQVKAHLGWRVRVPKKGDEVGQVDALVAQCPVYVCQFPDPFCYRVSRQCHRRGARAYSVGRRCGLQSRDVGHVVYSHASQLLAARQSRGLRLRHGTTEATEQTRKRKRKRKLRGVRNLRGGPKQNRCLPMPAGLPAALCASMLLCARKRAQEEAVCVYVYVCVCVCVCACVCH